MSNLQKIHDLLPDNTEREISEKDLRDSVTYIYEDMVMKEPVDEIGSIVTTSNSVTVNVFNNIKNTVFIDGIAYTKATPSTFSFTPVVTNLKELNIYALPTSQLFYLAEGVESPEATQPPLPSGAKFIRRITVRTDGQDVEQPIDLTGFKEKAEDNWKKVYPSGRTGNFNLHYSDKRTFFSLEQNSLGAANGFSNIVFYINESRDVTFTVRNNYGVDITIFESDTDGLSKGIFNHGEDFILKENASIIVKYNHEFDRLEILNFGATVDLTNYHTIAQYQQWVANQSFATNIALTSGLANRYQITTTNITAPDATFWAVLITDSSANVRRLNLANYLSGNFATISSVNTSIANATKSKIQITTTVDITSDSNDTAGLSQKGRSTNINNGATNINYTVNAGLSDILVGMKTGAGSVTFLQGAGVTLIAKDGSNILDGVAGGQYKIEPTQTANVYFLFLTTYE